MAGRNERAVNATLKDMKLAGVLAVVPKAVVELVRSMAAAVDAEPGNAALAREYRASLDDLREAASGATDDDTAEFRISIQTPRGRASLVDPEDS